VEKKYFYTYQTRRIKILEKIGFSLVSDTNQQDRVKDSLFFAAKVDQSGI